MSSTSVRLIAALTCAAGSLSATAQVAEPFESAIVRLNTPEPHALEHQLDDLGFAVDCDADVSSDHIDLIVSQGDFTRLLNLGLQPQILRVGQPFRLTQQQMAGGDQPPNGYPDLADIYTEMNSIASQYPSIAQVVNITQMLGGPQTHEGRDIYAMKISDNVATNEDEPNRLVISCHHVREIVTPLIALDAMKRLTSGYASDPSIQSIVNNNEIWIIATNNPDGYEYVFNVNDLWRKNRRNNGGSFGVDLNRNYPQGWAAACGGDTNGNSETYRGPSAGSEPETQIIMQLTEARRFASVIDFHSYGQETLYAYNCLNHPFESFYGSEASAISVAHGYGMTRPPSAEGEHYEWQFSHFGANAYLTETGTQFQPAYASGIVEAESVWGGTKLVLQRPISVFGHVTDAVTGLPVEATVSLVGVNFPNGETNSSGGMFGQYFWTLPTGNYTLQYSAPCYQTTTRTLSVTGSSAQTIDVQLQPDGSGSLTFDLPGGAPNMVNANGGTTFDVNVSPSCGAVPQPNTGVLHVSIDGGAFATYPMAQNATNMYTATFPGVPCNSAVTYYLSAQTQGGQTATMPSNAPASTYSADPFTSSQLSFSDNFETNTGWSAENLGATSGDWERGVPVNDPGWAYDPESDSDGSGSCLLTQNAVGNTDVDAGAVRITSPSLDLLGVSEISYDYYLNLSNDNGADALVVEMSTNGTSGPWAEIARNDTNGDLSWRTQIISADTIASAGLTPSANSRIRFTVNDDNPQSVVEAGIDAFKVTKTLCESSCYADCDGSGALNIFDYICFGNEYASGTAYADCDGSGSLNIFDYICFGNAYAAGCP
ncbi:MAG: carboxypeptidase regulatory-like domain-containing protein [Phycisphaeraceae bacterium]|nr:carboxypeptidase regulatory-like domain-containing protein [Phycisphaerales bacterium]MCB9860307.1 carboxypeptidase regulatory-like domain-containing protein [Phycisphaeraceae bacterium]